MRFDIIRQPMSVTLVTFTLLLALFWGRHMLAPIPQESFALCRGPIGEWINSWVADIGIMAYIATTLMILINAFYITRIMANNMILATRTYLPAIFYLTISCGMFFSSNMLLVAISGYLITRASQFFIDGFRRHLSFDLFFRGAFLIGVSALIYPPTIVMTFIILIALRLFHRNMRESMIAFGGLLLPLLLCSYIYWAIGFPFSHVAVTTWQSMVTTSGYTVLTPEIGVCNMIFMGTVILITAVSIGTFTTHLRTIRNKAQRVYTYNIYMLVALLAILLLPCRSTADYTLIATPLAVIMPAYFVKHTGYFATILWIVLIGSVVAGNLLQLL